MPSAPLKIVHIAATPIGAPWMVALMCEQKRLGHEVAAILPSEGGIAAQLASHGISFHVADVDVLFALPTVFQKAAALLRLARLLRRLRPDIVHSHIFNSVVTARLASWLADVPLHIGGNVHPFSLESDVLRPIEVGTAFCDGVTVASTSYTRELMVRHGIPANKIALIFYAVDQRRHDPALADGSRVRNELGIAADTPVVGKIAYFYPPAKNGAILTTPLKGRGIKGHEVLIRASRLVLDEFPRAKFLLVGRGWGSDGLEYEQALKKLTEDLGVSDSIIFTGERQDIPDLLAAFDVAVQCSLCDNLGGTVEALFMAKPLVASDIGGFADTVQNERTGLAVPADQPRAFAEAIIRLLRDRDFAHSLGEAGRRHVVERFSLSRTVADYERLFAAKRRAVERHYRLRATVIRTFWLPFRLLPVWAGIYRGLRSQGVSPFRFTLGRLRRPPHPRVADRGAGSPRPIPPDARRHSERNDVVRDRSDDHRSATDRGVRPDRHLRCD